MYLAHYWEATLMLSLTLGQRKKRCFSFFKVGEWKILFFQKVSMKLFGGTHYNLGPLEVKAGRLCV